jgi:large subunit ribosomal protein L7/L12
VRATVAAAPAHAARWYSDEAASVPGAAAEVSPKIRGIVDQISSLTLLEVADLCSVLKTELNIADAAPMAFAAGPAAAAPADDAPAEEEESAGPSVVNVTLTGYKDDSKIKVIKEVKNIMAKTDPKFNLAAAKRFVEELPGTLKEKLGVEEAEALKEALEKAGAEVKLV